MEKIKAKLKEEKIKVIEFEGFKIKINLDEIVKIDEFIPIVSHKKINDETYEVYTSVLDSDLNVVVPIRKEIMSLQRIADDDLNINITLFKKGKAIYQTLDGCYLIDLHDTKFDKDNIPLNYISKFKAYYNIGNGIIIVYNEADSYIYDVVKDKINGFVCDFIIPSENFKGLYETYFSKRENGIILSRMRMFTNEEGIPSEEVIVNDILTVYPLREMFDDKDKLIKYCDDCFNEYIKTEESTCKTVS